MKKLIISIFSILVFVSPNFAFAQDQVTSSPTASPTLTQRQILKNDIAAQKATITDQRVTNLKQRADIEIDRRVTALTGLITKINKVKKISSAQKTELISKVQAEIDALNTLKVKIDADTDITTLRADVKSIVDSYRVFLLFMPQIQLIGAADRLAAVASDLSSVSTKLQTRITNAQSSGHDVTLLNTWISDLNSKVSDANSISSAVINEVINLTPQGYPDNKPSILDARSKMKTGIKDISSARLDALNIIKQLKTWDKVASTPTPTPTP